MRLRTNLYRRNNHFSFIESDFFVSGTCPMSINLNFFVPQCTPIKRGTTGKTGTDNFYHFEF